MKNLVSFTQTVKEELVSNEYESLERLKALLSAYLRSNASLTFANKKTNLVLKNENAKIAKFIYSHINDIYGKAHLSFLNKGNTKKTYYVITIEDSERITEDLDIDFFEGKISKNIA